LAGELDGEEIIITREVSAAGKNLCKLNGQLVTLGELTETCRRLADIHGQYDNQSLLNPENHIRLVDNYHEEDIRPVRESFDESFAAYGEIRTKWRNLLALESDNQRKLDFYRYEKAEIDAADLKIGEDEALEERISILQNSEKIFGGIETAYSCLRDGSASALTNLGNGLRALQDISAYSKEISEMTEEFADMYYRLEDISSELRDIRESITFSPNELDSAIARLDQIEKLKKKYGSSIEEILIYCEKITLELEQIENYDDVKAALEKDLNAALSDLQQKASALTAVRKASAEELSAAIEAELHDLNFSNAELSIRFEESESIGVDGNDLVEIFISTNKGEPLKPLVKIASGGEISRIMLAIKNITGTYDKIPTMIFDEIDAGISGITASIVGRKLREIAENHQVICITHLPQIAACGDANYRIHKESDDDSTYTNVDRLAEEEVVDEIARLLGGENITDTTRLSAKELMDSVKK
jgi:DNA repair protein RecN (Recombination protein N)